MSTGLGTVQNRAASQNIDLGLMAAEVLYIGSTDGVWALDLDHADRGCRRLGLEGTLVNQVACATDGTLVAAVPQFGIMHHLQYHLDPDRFTRNTSNEAGLWMRYSHEGSKFHRVAAMDARSCAVCPGSFTMSHEETFLVGAEPAAVYAYTAITEQLRRIDTFDALPTRPQWRFPVKPYRPHVLSLDFANEALVVGVEEGGVLTSLDAGHSWRQSPAADTDSLSDDVHAARADPHSTRIYAATGEGLFVCEELGKPWRLLSQPWMRRYTLGLALNWGRHGEILATAAEKPPNNDGAHVYHSLDSGETWIEIDTQQFGTQLHAPVPLFTSRSAVLGFWDGQVFACDHGEGVRGADERLLGACHRWHRLCALPAGVSVTSLAVAGRSPSSVMH